MKSLSLFCLLLLMIAMVPVFNTPPEQVEAATSFTFTAAGDIAFDTDIPWLQANGGSFFLVLGDLGYSSDEVGWCNYIRGIGRPVIWVVGNHDTNEDGPGDFFQYQSACPPPTGFNFVGTWGSNYYFDYPAINPIARFIAIAAGVGGNQVDGDFSTGSTAYNWLSTTIGQANTQGLWTVLYGHKPCITVGSKSCEPGGDYLSLATSSGVDLILHGHDHNYQRSHQIACATGASCIIDVTGAHSRNAGTVQVIDGSGGQCCYSVSGSDPEAFYFQTYTANGNVVSTFTVTDTSLNQVATGVNGFGFSDSFSIGGTPGPSPLTAGFTYSPNSPVDGTSVTFTASATGGTSPYSYSWDLAGTPANGQVVAKTFPTGSYSISLTITDSASNTAGSTQILAVAPTGNAGGGARPTSWPYLVGWGGPFISETTISSIASPSLVFAGESASNMELIVQRMKASGYNTVRASFEPFCTIGGGLGDYSATNLQRAISIAQYYDFWIIVDYHGYDDMQGTLRDCWLNFWSGVTNQFRTSYSKLIWEPLNEPIGIDVARLSESYQLWIDQTRAQGDTHWIVVQNLCSNTCSFSDYSQGYPTVEDPSVVKVFISLHSYMGYPYVTPWTFEQAEAYANQFYQAVLVGELETGWPSLNTEGGADELCDCGAPDEILTGSAGYTLTSYHFIERVTQLYNNHVPRINWIWWPAGSWTDTPGAGVYGALADNGWGTILGSIIPPPSDNGVGLLQLFYQNILFIGAGALAIFGVVVLLAPPRRRR
jgi:hypothetical protein